MSDDRTTLKHGGTYEFPPSSPKTLGLGEDAEPVEGRVRHVSSPAPGRWRMVTFGGSTRIQVRCPECCETVLCPTSQVNKDGLLEVECAEPGCDWNVHARLSRKADG